MRDLLASIIEAVTIGHTVAWLLTLASGVAAGAERDWSFSTPETVQGETVVEFVMVEKIVEVPATQYRWGYPVRDSRTWYTHPGVHGLAGMRKHLKTRVHAGKFDDAKLDDLTLPELESLHSDDHQGRVKQFAKVVIPSLAVLQPATPIRGSTLVWNKEFLATAPPAANPTGPLRWIIETNPACAVCVKNWSDAMRELKKGGWSFGGPGNHFQREEVRFDHPIPVWKLMLGDKEVTRHVGYTSSATLSAEYLREFEIANAPQGPAKAIDAGTISKDEVQGYVSLFVKWFGPEGSAVVPNLKRREPCNGMNIDVPANVRFSWIAGTDGGFALNFNPDTRPVGRWGIFSQSVSAMIYDPSIGEVRFVTPMARYSPVLKVVD